MMLTMLLLVLMVCMTLGIASRAREKAELQTMADAAAYSNAIATARTYNAASLLNRVMVSHYAAITTVQAHVAWVTSIQAVFGQAAGMAREFEIPYPPGLNGPRCQNWRPTPQQREPWWYQCPEYWRDESVTSCRSANIRPVSYELWHAALSNYRANPAYSGDSVNGACSGAGGSSAATDCSDPRPWLNPKGMPELDEMVADQVKDIHEAIFDLANTQSRTYRALQDVTVRNKITKEIVEKARGRSGWGPFRSEAEQVAARELDLATDVNQPHQPPYADTMGQAVMGARVAGLAIEHDTDVLTERMRALKNQADRNLGRMPGGWDFRVEREPDVRGLVAPSVAMADEVEGRNLDPTMRVLYGDLQIRIGLSWTPTCGPGAGVRKTISRPIRVVIGTAKGQAWHYIHDGGGHTGPSGNVYAGGWNACHVGHAHYGENDETIHYLRHEVLPREALGFVFPTRYTGGGAGGIFGVPKMPVVLSKRTGGQPDPWELDFRFRFSRNSSATRLDLEDGSANELPELAAYSAGVAYYHRRFHIGEPPNMLNPFWRATLVPAEIDEHNQREGDNTRTGRPAGGLARDTGGGQGPLRYDPMARTAYRALRQELKGLENP